MNDSSPVAGGDARERVREILKAFMIREYEAQRAPDDWRDPRPPDWLVRDITDVLAQRPRAGARVCQHTNVSVGLDERATCDDCGGGVNISRDANDFLLIRNAQAAPVERAASKKAGGDPPIGEQLGGVATVNSDAREALPSPAPPAPVERTSDDRAPQAGGSRGDHRNLSREAAIGDIQPPPSAPVAPADAGDPREAVRAILDSIRDDDDEDIVVLRDDLRAALEVPGCPPARGGAGPTDAVATRCEGCGARVAPDPETPDGRGHRVPNADGSPGYCGPISAPGPTDEALADLADQLHQARGDYWQVQRCPSCDDHGGHGREWSVWAGGAQGVRVAHGLDQHEALTIAKHVNTLREAMEDLARAFHARLAPGATGGTT